MSLIEELLYSAHEHGKRDALLKRVTEIRESHEGSTMKREEIYEMAYKEVLKTR